MKKPDNLVTVEANKTLYAKRILALLFILKNILGYTTKYKVKFFLKKKKKKSFNILRAPYKNKIAQNSYTWSRYYFSIIFVFYDNLFIDDEQKLQNLLMFWFNSLFSTNISILKSIKISYNILHELKI